MINLKKTLMCFFCFRKKQNIEMQHLNLVHDKFKQKMICFQFNSNSRNQSNLLHDKYDKLFSIRKTF